MRTLLLLRHAEAQHVLGIGDIDRPLTQRGREQVVSVREWLGDHEIMPDLVVCSAAMRTRQTAELLRLKRPISYCDALYGGSEAALTNTLLEAPDDVETLLVVGHNPSIGAFAHDLCRTTEQQQILGGRYPTGTITQFNVGFAWIDFADGRLGCGDLVDRLIP